MITIKVFSAGDLMNDEEPTELIVRIRNGTEAAFTFVASSNNTAIRDPRTPPRFEELEEEDSLYHRLMVVVELGGQVPQGINTSGQVNAAITTIRSGETKLVEFAIPPSRIPSTRPKIWVELTELAGPRPICKSNVLQMRRDKH